MLVRYGSGAQTNQALPTHALPADRRLSPEQDATMPLNLEIEFVNAETNLEPTAAIIVDTTCEFGPVAKKLDKASGGHLKRAIGASEFKGKSKMSAPILAPHGTDLKRVIIVGAGDVAELSDNDWVLVGGYAFGQLAAAKGKRASVLLECEGLASAKRAAMVVETPRAAAPLPGFLRSP